MAVLFVFGAGASFGAMPKKQVAPAFLTDEAESRYNTNSIKFQLPPLGDKLFAELLRYSPAAREIRPEIKNKFHQNFETGMNYLFRYQNQLTAPFLNQMADYFSNFTFLTVNAANQNFSNTNFYERLLKIILESDRQCTLSTTNYDLLIEDAIENVGKNVSYAFEESKQFITLLKFHGSCNFIPDFVSRGISFENVSFDIFPGMQIIGDEDAFLSIDKHVAANRDEAKIFYKQSAGIPPAIAMYEPLKQVISGREVVKNQYNRWLRAVKNAQDIIIIGLKVHKENSKWADPHIWKELGQSKAKLHYVGGEPDSFNTWASENEKSNVEVMATTFEGAIKPIATMLSPKCGTKQQINHFIDEPFIARQDTEYNRYRGL